MPPEGPKVTVRPSGDAWILTPPPNLQAEAEDALVDAVDQALTGGCKKLIIDLSGVTFANSAGIGALVLLFVRAERRGVPIVLAGAHGIMRILLDRTGIARHVKTADSVEAALAETPG